MWHEIYLYHPCLAWEHKFRLPLLNLASTPNTSSNFTLIIHWWIDIGGLPSAVVCGCCNFKCLTACCTCVTRSKKGQERLPLSSFYSHEERHQWHALLIKVYIMIDVAFIRITLSLVSLQFQVSGRPLLEIVLAEADGCVPDTEGALSST